MKRRITAILLMLSCCCLLFSGVTEKSLNISFDTSQLNHMECGFAKGPGPGPGGLSNPDVQTKAIGGGSFSPATECAMKVSKDGAGNLDIHSDIYTLWVFKIGLSSVYVNLTGFPMTFRSNSNVTPIGYDVYISQKDPVSLTSPSFSVDPGKSETLYRISDPELVNRLIQYWETKFIVRVDALPADLDQGVYTGALQLEVVSN